MFFVILFSIPLLTMAWTAWLWWMLRRAGGKLARIARWACAGTVVLALATYGWVIVQRFDVVEVAPPSWLQALLLLWAIVFLPFMALPTMGGHGLLLLARSATAVVTRWFGAGLATPRDEAPSAAASAVVSRREMLRTAALALPAFGTLGATAVSIPQKTRFRVRSITIPVAGLPRALEGMTITHLSDTHVGKFTRGRVLDELAEAANRLRSDLVLLTGDLIDHSIRDLPDALDMIERLDPGRGLFNVEGNHDLFDGAEAFASGHASRGIPLLRDAMANVRVKGHPVQILGISWRRREDEIRRQVEKVAAAADPGAFPILLAHHPHAFDAASAHGIPLTLAGHTHGGQLMLTPDLGPGPMMFRYGSGLYQESGRSLVVSNGAGNWFPLRTSAPAEIVHITLQASRA